MTEKHKPRWKVYHRVHERADQWTSDIAGPRLDNPVTTENFAGQADGLDVYVSGSRKTVIAIVCSIERAQHNKARHTYTNARVRSGGQLRLLDDDVVPSPYEMCLIYQLYEAYINDRET